MTPKSHAYIIASNSEAAREKAALELAQSLVCCAGGDKPCGVCPECRRAAAGVHPDIILIDRQADDKGKLRREVYVDQVRAMSADAWIRPQQAERKVYVIREAGLMNPAAQNAALKLLEEPPAYAVFILCASSDRQLLPTVRSRCVLLRLGEEEASPENEQALRLIRAAASGSERQLLELCCEFEALDTEKTTELIAAAGDYLRRTLCREKTGVDLPPEKCVTLLKVIDTAEQYLKMNVGAKHVWGYVSVSAILK